MINTGEQAHLLLQLKNKISIPVLTSSWCLPSYEFPLFLRMSNAGNWFLNLHQDIPIIKFNGNLFLTRMNFLVNKQVIKKWWVHLLTGFFSAEIPRYYSYNLSIVYCTLERIPSGFWRFSGAPFVVSTCNRRHSNRRKITNIFLFLNALFK